MKTQTRKDADAQSLLEFSASSHFGGSALSAQEIAEAEAPGSVADNSASPEWMESGDLPADWPLRPLGDCLALIRNGLTARQNRDGVGHPVTRIETISEDRINPHKVGYIADANPEQVARYVLQTGDILFSHINSEPQMGRTAIYQGGDTPLLHGMNLLLLRANERVDPWFLHYQCQNLRSRGVFIGLAARAVGQSSINQGKLKALRIIAPPLSEQRAIAAVLRTVQEAKEACDRVRAATRQLKQSLHHHLFTYGFIPFPKADRVLLKQTEMGTMPEHWRPARVGDLGDVVTGSTPSTKRSEYYGGRHMFIAPGDMGAGKYITTTEKWITAKGLGECRALPKNAVVVVCIGATIGKTGLTTEDNCATNQQCNTVIANAEADPEFLFYALSNRSSALPDLAGRAAVPILNKSNFCLFKVALPPLSEQREIARQLSAVDAKLVALESRQAALAALFNSLLQHLMTARLRLPEFVGGAKITARKEWHGK